MVDCDDARRAEKTRFTIWTVAPVPLKLAEILVKESEHTFTGLPSGTPVKIEATGVNAAGESLPSDPLLTTVP